MAKILVVEDDQEMSLMLSNCLMFEHYVVEAALNGTDGLYMLQCYTYDLAIVDWQLPGMTGIELCQKFRSGGGTTPILMLTGKTQVSDKATGLDSGADDYLVKPFHLQELTARVRALLRRAGASSTSNVLKAGDMSLDPTQHQVTVQGKDLQLIPKEFAILELLMRYPGKVFGAEEIVYRVWKADESGSPEAVRTHIKNLRKKLADMHAASTIETVHGVGYKFAAKDSEAST